jgi:elongation factor P hydroxylase
MKSLVCFLSKALISHLIDILLSSFITEMELKVGKGEDTSAYLPSGALWGAAGVGET